MHRPPYRIANLGRAATAMVERHRATDAQPVEPDVWAAKTVQRLTRLERGAVQMRDWLAHHPNDRPGAKGAVRQAIAPITSARRWRPARARSRNCSTLWWRPQPLLTTETCITADAGYHSEANLVQLATMQVTALIADNDRRRRDERFTTQDQHRAAPDPLHDKTRKDETPSIVQPRDFTYDAAARTCVCPVGQSL